MKRALPQYTAPSEFLDEAAAVSAHHAEARGDGDDSVPAATRSRRVAAHEDDYRRQWRARACLSPPKADPYARLAARTGVPLPQYQRPPPRPQELERARTYRDVMAEHDVAVEQAEVARALRRQEDDERAQARAQAQQQQRRGEKEKGKDEEKKKKDGKEDEDEDEEEDEGPRWFLAVVKDGATLAQVDLGVVARASGDGTVKFGAAEAGCDVVLAHASCSARHAKLRVPPLGDAAACPRLVDLGSAHGTFVDGARLAPGVYRALPDGAVVTFAHSTRQYLVMRR